jgi:ubiquinone/menaquinone biosynthesis C-methylase UbiE
MTERPEYIFSNVHDAAEHKRLRSIESIFDPVTQRWLEEAGLGAGSRALEVGAGAGSIAAWMADKVGEAGYVTAVDLNARFLKNLSAPNLKTVESDIIPAPLEPGFFDIAHARYLLVHVPDPVQALNAMAAALKTGGKIVLEEPDFLSAKPLGGPADQKKAFANVNRAMWKMFRDKKFDPGFGQKLSELAKSLGFTIEKSETEVHAAPGGSPLARMMSLSAQTLTAAYLAAGATAEDVAGYRALSENPGAEGIFYSTMRLTAQKGARN